VLRVSRDVVELVDREDGAVEGVRSEPFESEPQRRVCADQGGVGAVEEVDKRVDLARGGARGAEVVLGLDLPVGEEAGGGQFRWGERRTDRPFRNRDDNLLPPLIVDLVQGDKHERARLARRRRSLNEQVLRIAPCEHSLLHLAHAKGIGVYRRACLCVGDIDDVHRLARSAVTHFFPLLASSSAVIRSYIAKRSDSRSSSVSYPRLE